MFQLGELDLQLAFETARALRENVQDEARTIQHATPEFFLEVSFLAWIKRRTRNHKLGFALFDQLAEFIEFSLTDEKPGIRPTARTDKLARYHRARGTGQLGKLLAFRLVR
jgi:hypothetical protein